MSIRSQRAPGRRTLQLPARYRSPDQESAAFTSLHGQSERLDALPLQQARVQHVGEDLRELGSEILARRRALQSRQSRCQVVETTGTVQ